MRHSSIRQHLIDVGLDGDIAEYNELKGLSGGQKVKVVIASVILKVQIAQEVHSKLITS